MRARHRSDRRTLCWALAFAVALLLKAAVPLLAHAAASAQGKALVEVCSVYGVRTVALDATPTAPATDTAHHADHCVLGGLLTLGGTTPDSPSLVPGAAPAEWSGPRGLAPPPDASARWLTGLSHAPPART